MQCGIQVVPPFLRGCYRLSWPVRLRAPREAPRPVVLARRDARA